MGYFIRTVLKLNTAFKSTTFKFQMKVLVVCLVGATLVGMCASSPLEKADTIPMVPGVEGNGMNKEPRRHYRFGYEGPGVEGNGMNKEPRIHFGYEGPGVEGNGMNKEPRRHYRFGY